MAQRDFIITIGASAGGVNAIRELLSQLPPEINASLFVVLHLSKTSLGDILVSRFQKKTAMPCKLGEDKEAIKRGTVYIAPPNAHLLVKDGEVLIGRGPAENRFRPSIDVLFRSAAASHNEKVIGVILTGYLNDGTVGMSAIKLSGGHCIVQDPNEAEYPDMPLSVLESMEVDEVVPLKNMGAAILKIIQYAKEEGITAPPNVLAESKLSEKSVISIEKVGELGKKTLFSCPDCGGGLWEIENGKLVHYRCHVGHSYSESDLLLKQIESIEKTLWISLRMLEERKLLLVKLAREHNNKGLEKMSENYITQAEDISHNIDELKALLIALQDD
jgi:two-component system chemotaxis response regulator CheB